MTDEEQLERWNRTSMCRGLPSRLALGLCAALAAAGLGCDSAVADERIEVTAAELPASAGLDAEGVWQSVGWTGDPWQRYPGRVTLVLHHDLGRIPAVMLTYLAFDESGRGAGLAAGDMARVVEVTASTVTVRNDTEADFFCRVVLE